MEVSIIQILNFTNYVALNARITEASLKVQSENVLGAAEENHENLQSVWPVFVPIFEPGTF